MLFSFCLIFKETVKKENYLEMLKEFFWPKVLRTAEYKKTNFQQDGARPHTMEKGLWPPRSPDLNLCDLYLCVYLKSVVYNPLPKTLGDL